MALIDTALETVRETLEDVVDVASTGVGAVTSAISDVTEDERSRKGLVILIVVALLAVVGIVVWRRASSRGDEGGEASSAAA
jgi:hypothetical protein